VRKYRLPTFCFLDVPASAAYFMGYEMLLRNLTPEGKEYVYISPYMINFIFLLFFLIIYLMA